MMRRLVIPFVLVAACAPASPALVATPAAVTREEVAVVGEAPDPACVRVDDLTAAALDERAAVEKLRAEAAARGANVLVFVGDIRDVPLGWSATGRALRCPPPPPPPH